MAILRASISGFSALQHDEETGPAQPAAQQRAYPVLATRKGSEGRRYFPVASGPTQSNKAKKGNGELPFHLSHLYVEGTQRERENVYAVIGERMQPDRCQKSQDVYRSSGSVAVLKTYPDIGHGIDLVINTEIAEFLRFEDSLSGC